VGNAPKNSVFSGETRRRDVAKDEYTFFLFHGLTPVAIAAVRFEKG